MDMTGSFDLTQLAPQQVALRSWVYIFKRRFETGSLSL
jgi:hypothetical protein